ncbi:DUF302 domain-containing protein [Salibacterium halotolerans]|uniref:Uncharacterized conserved protein, DUF302 family n=1 Tax=Salibacterium halotolerans TaxID=1884432 RepID=A0A1I5YCR8_9BACI|nr:DUF302 domain-containing protein [Salibacterium halotolerans]SFQ41920.1 Uncharacterized conserved protein, DUF302 family [Salibacterium halotolerans]
MFHYTVTTDQTVDHTVQALSEVLQDEGFGVLWDFDVKDTLKGKGIDYNRNYRILEVCNPQAAKEALTLNHMVGYFLPCKVVIYEENGETQVGMPKPTVLMDMIGDESLNEFAADIEKRMASCMDKVSRNS